VTYVADLMTGYFAAIGAMLALERRAREGGSYQVRVSLTKSTMWVNDLGLYSDDEIADLPPKDEYPADLMTNHTAFGDVTTLRNPLKYTGLTLPANHRLVPVGADKPVWQTLQNEGTHEES
jgi:peptidoglycan hydrolase-like protein with peptidoglycan-binding domain